MENVSAENQIANAPQLPIHPICEEQTAEDRQDGVCEDVPGLLQHAALVRNMQNKPFIMPVSACVEVWTKERS